MQNLPLAINLTFVGIVVVFAALIILSYCIVLLSKILSFANGRPSGTSTNNKDKETAISEVNESANVNLSENDVTESELIAVLTAAIQASLGIKSENKIMVKSFRRIPVTAPAWNAAGRVEQISARL
jgi:sodium pump decarboxylase gamma subunit